MYVQSLHLENIKAFDKLDVEFTRTGEHGSLYAGLNVFVGGNSSGKSTLLKCIAMALSGPTIANQQLITPAGWVRRGAKRGAIELKVRWDPTYDSLRGGGKSPAGDGFSVGLVFETEQDVAATVLKSKDYYTPKRTKLISAERGPWNADTTGWLLGAYGPMRRLTGSSTEALRYALGRGNLGSCVTLFREDAALSESETWIKQEYARALEQQSQERTPSALVEQVQTFLNDGLLPKGFRIAKVSVDHVYMTTPNGGDLPMRDLSDGCRSAFALMLDIVHSMTLAYPGKNLFEQDKQGLTVVNKPGVILIDEVEAHLHPSWQRLICEWFKTRFPQVQFFLTTHSPLIAQAADEGGLFVLPLPDEIASGRRIRRLSAQEQQRIALGSAEKVLLGEAFGLKHTWSPRAERLVEEWERLAAQRNAQGSLPPAAEKKYTELSEQVEIVFDDLPEEATHA
jgi:energy-coupling factor transporter ATP-binding protein EcfA2